MPREKSSPPVPSAVDGEESESPFGREVLGGLERGLLVLAAFNANQRQMTLADIARAVELPRATTRRAVNTLQNMGYIASDGRLYRLTPKVMRLAAAYAASNQITTFLQPLCEELSREFDEGCSAAVLDDGEAVRVAYAAPPRIVSMFPGIGLRVPAWCSSLGRALLTGMPDKELVPALARMNIVKHTSTTITDRAELLREIQSARANGYALVDRETQDGFRSVAVPVKNFQGVTVAALSTGVRVETMTLARMRQRFLPRLKEAAQALEHQLL